MEVGGVMVRGARRVRRRVAEPVDDSGPVASGTAVPAEPAHPTPLGPVSAGQLSYLQSTAGNAMVLRLLGTGTGTAGGAPVAGLAGRIESRLGGGESLPGDVRERYASGLGTSLSDVRVHHDAAAADLAGAVGARAFTTGSDVFFGAGQYAPDTPEGAHLLAHELVHTTQPAAAPGTGLSVSEPADGEEIAADRAARHLIAGERVELSTPASGATVRRTADDQAEAPAPAVDISWIDGLPAYIQEQIDMFKQATLDKATGAKQQKLVDQRQRYREIFVTDMMRYLGTEDQVRAHFQAINPIDVGGGGDQLWVHDSTRERLMAVQADLAAKNIPMPATTVGQSLRGRHLHDTGGAGMMTHGLGFACDWKAYAAPHIKDTRLHTLFETVTGGPASFHLEVGGKALGHEARRDLIEQMGQGTADPARAQQLLDSVGSEYTRLAQASADFKSSLPESGLAPLREVERRRTEVDQLSRKLARAAAKDKPAAQVALADAQRAFETAKADVQANQATIFKPWLDELAKRGADIEKAAADKGVDLRAEVTTAGGLKDLEHHVTELHKGVAKIEKDAKKLLDEVRDGHQALLDETAGIESGLADDAPDKATLLATAHQLLAESDGLETDVGDLMPDHKPSRYRAGRGRKRTVEGWTQALDKARDRLGQQRTRFTEIDGPLRTARTDQQATADDIAARKQRNANVSSKVGKEGLAQLQADRTTLFWLDETAKALRTNTDFVLKSRDVADPGITQLLGLMSGTQGGGFFTPDAEQGGENEAAQGKWSSTHGYNMEFFKAMVAHGFELGVAWDGFADTMHFELVEGRRLAASGGSRALVAGAHSH